MPRPNNGHKGFKPKAQGYSAQGIQNVTTPEGKSMLDEEFRRIDQALKNVATAAAPVVAAATQAAQSSSAPPAAASDPRKMTIKHNSITVIQSVLDTINIEDTNTVLFDVTPTTPREAKIVAHAANDSLYKAKRVGEILYSADGRTFLPEWPLTSLEAGIILTGDGIIMIAR